MRRLTILSCLVLLLVFSNTALACPCPPSDIVFVLQGQTTDPGEQILWKHGTGMTVKGIEAEGTVNGDLEGTFEYVEDSEIRFPKDPNDPIWKSSQQGQMTIDVSVGCPDGPGTLQVRFWGKSQIDWSSLQVTIISQPFQILGGTDGCEGARGKGTRDATFGIFEQPFTVTYTAKVHWLPD